MPGRRTRCPFAAGRNAPASTSSMLVHERGRRLAAALFALFLYATAHGSAERLVACAQEPSARPRVGLALGGGSARGLAHVGVLEWPTTTDALRGYLEHVRMQLQTSVSGPS